MKLTDEKVLKFLPLIVGAIIFLLMFFVGIFAIDFTVGESLMLAAFLGAIAVGVTWWRESGW